MTLIAYHTKDPVHGWNHKTTLPMDSELWDDVDKPIIYTLISEGLEVLTVNHSMYQVVHGEK